MRERLGIYAPDEGTFRLIPRLLRNPSLEIAAIVVPGSPPPSHPDPAIRALLTGETETLLCDPTLSAVIEGGTRRSLGARHPEWIECGIPVLSPFAARLLWGLGAPGPRHADAVLQGLLDISEAADFHLEPDDLCADLLQLALRVTGAEGGSFLSADPAVGELRVGAAVGIERELWHKIRIPPGVGVAGRVAELGRPLRLRGPALPGPFLIVRERRDVAASLCLPLRHEDRAVGVLNLHHATDADAFPDATYRYARKLAGVFARIHAASVARESHRRRGRLDAAAMRVSRIFGEPAPRDELLAALCRFVAEDVGSGVAAAYVAEPGAGNLRLAATSLEGSGFGGAYRLRVGRGVDGAVAASHTPRFLADERGALAYAALPLVCDGHFIGLLTVQRGAGEPADPDAEAVLREVARRTAEAILRTDRERRAATRGDKLAAITEHHLRMIQAADLAEAVRIGTSGAAAVLEADHSIVRLHDPRTGRFAIRSCSGATDRSQRTRLFHLDQRVASEAVRRREALILRDLPSDPGSPWFTTAAQTAIATPLWRDGRIVGTLAAYDRVSGDGFSLGNFEDDDLPLLGRFAAALEQAVEIRLAHDRADRSHLVDGDTGLPNAAAVAETIHAEIVRASQRGAALALAVCSIENFEVLDGIAEGAHIPRLLARIADAMAAHVREFDVIARTGPAEFTVVFPDPGPDPADRIIAFARAVAHDVAKDDSLNEPLRIELGFGYAVHPDDGRDRAALLNRARTLRIHMF